MNICIYFANSVIRFKYYPIRMNSTMMDATTVDISGCHKRKSIPPPMLYHCNHIVRTVDVKGATTPHIWSNVPLNSIWGPPA